MLIEMYSPAFREKGEIRKPIHFKEGLNVILGKEDGANSIGKSSALLAIDFVFGGNTYLKSDVIEHIGHHTIFFTFQFDNAKYYFARSTEDSDNFFLCDMNYNLNGISWTKNEYTDWLKKKYHIDFTGLSFRIVLSSFFRIHGKGNTDEQKPLRGIPGENMEKSISTLVALFDRNKDIEVFQNDLKDIEEKLNTYKKARKYDFISNLVGGQAKYEENLDRIHELQIQLELLTDDTEKAHSEEEIEKSQEKAKLESQKLMLETELQSKRRKLDLIDMSMEYGMYPTEADLSALQEYFPEVNLRKLYDVEKFHKKLATILDEQFSSEKQSLKEEIATTEQLIAQINSQISDMGYIGNFSKEFLDRHAEIKAEISALTTQNNAYLKQKELQEAKSKADEILKRGIEDILHEIEDELNEKMQELDAVPCTVPRKPPYVKFYSYNKYEFKTPDDTGSGSNYRSMVIYDLAVLSCTALPAIAHDSLILKQISDGSIEGIMKIYESSSKQIFVSFDKPVAYTDETQKILERNMVLKLSDNGCELYGMSWNKKGEDSNENEL